MDFYTQVLLQMVLALGAAMMFGNIMAILKRNKDKQIALESLKTSKRSSKHASGVLARNQVKEGKATLAVAPLGRSIIFIAIGFIVSLWSLVTLLN